jgi:hypothetical protein
METLQFSIRINASKQKVWTTMLGDQSYSKWTKEFQEGSYFEGSWEKGSEIRFLAQDKNGQLQGMCSRIKENFEYQFISIEHFGLINDDVIDTESEQARKWTPAFENYTLNGSNNITDLVIDIQIDAGFKPMFEEMWPRALKALKSLCEK